MASPYFNRQERLQTLAKHIFADINKEWTYERLFELLYRSAQPYRKQAVYDALSQLQRLLERFLALKGFESNTSSQQIMLLQSLAKLQAEEAFQKQWKKAQNHWQQYPYQDLAYFEGQYALHRQASIFEATRQRRDQDAHLQKTVDFLDRSYWSARLKFACEKLNRSHILSQPLEASEDILPYLPPPLYHEKSIRAYLLIYRALQSPDDLQCYQEWISWLNENSQHFTGLEAIDMYNYAQNYCVRKINQGQTVFLQNLFALFEQLTEKQLLLGQNGYMDHRKLKNMVTVGLRLQAFEWVDRFLHSYRDKLMPDFQEDAFRFNLASLRHAQEQYSEALKLLNQVEFRDVFYLLSAKSLLIRIYYETDEDTALVFQFENFRLFLQRNRLVSRFQRNVHLNLLRFTRKLFRLREQRGILDDTVFAERLLKLESQISETADVANSSWLLAQVGILTG